MCRILGELVADLKRRNIPVAPEVIEELETAQTLIGKIKANADYGDLARKIDAHLLKAQSHLIPQAKKRYGSKYANL